MGDEDFDALPKTITDGIPWKTRFDALSKTTTDGIAGFTAYRAAEKLERMENTG